MSSVLRVSRESVENIPTKEKLKIFQAVVTHRFFGEHESYQVRVSLHLQAGQVLGGGGV